MSNYMGLIVDNSVSYSTKLDDIDKIFIFVPTLYNGDLYPSKSSVYQIKCRIYLDEYPEQEELRKEWFEKINYWKNVFKGFKRLASAGILEFDVCIKKPDNYFINRWLTRK